MVDLPTKPNASLIITPDIKPQENIQPTGVGEAFKAAFFDYGGFNTEALKNELQYSFSAPTDYNPYKDDLYQSIDPQTRDRYDRLIGQATSTADLQDKLKNIETYQHYLEIADFNNDITGAGASTAYFLGAVLGGVLDPVNIATGYTGGGKAVELLYKGSSTALRAAGEGALIGATYGGVSATLSQTTLAMNEDEIKNFVAITAGAGLVLGGVLGHIGGRTQAATTEFTSALQDEVAKNDLSIGAATNVLSKRGERLILEEAGIEGFKDSYVSAPLKLLFNAGKYVLGKVSPTDDLVLNSMSGNAQLAAVNTTGYSLRFKNARPGDIKQNIYDSTIVTSSQVVTPVQLEWERTFASYKKAGGNKSQGQLREELYLAAATNQSTGNKILDDFLYGAYTKATKTNLQYEKDLGLIKSDYNPEGIYAHLDYDHLAISSQYDDAALAFGKKIADERLSTAQKEIRVFENKKQKLINQLEVADSNAALKIKILEGRLERAKNKEFLTSRINELKNSPYKSQAIKEKIAEVERQITQLQDSIKELNDKNVVKDLGSEYVDGILGADSGSPKIKINSNIPQSTLRRRFTDHTGLEKFIKKNDILKSLAANTREIHAAYHSKMVHGDMEWDGLYQNVREDFQKLHNKNKERLDAGKITQKQFDKKTKVINANEKNTIHNLNTLKNRTYGKFADGTSKYGFFQTLSNALSSIARITTGQSIALSQIPDLARILYGQATEKSILKVGATQATEVQGYLKSLSVAQLQESGITPGIDGRILEVALTDFDMAIRHNHSNAEILNIAGFDVEVNLGNINEALNKINTANYALNAMTPITIGTRYLGVNLAQRRLVRIIKEVADNGLSQNNKNYLEAVGLNTNDLDEFRQALDKHKTLENGVIDPHLEKWSSNLRAKYMTALRTDYTNHWVSEPNIGTKPGVLDGPTGNLFWMYKSFTIAAMRNYYLKSLQNLNAEELTVASMRIAMGSLAYILKGGANKGFDKVDYSKERLFYEGVMRSGAFSGADMAIQWGHALQDLSGGRIKTSIPYALGIYDERLNSRYNNDSVFEALAKEQLGASSVIIKDLGRLTKKRYTEYDYQRARSYVPIYGAWYVEMLRQNVLD